MANILKTSNEPSMPFSSWTSCFTCCYANQDRAVAKTPNHIGPPPTQPPAMKSHIGPPPTQPPAMKSLPVKKDIGPVYSQPSSEKKGNLNRDWDGSKYHSKESIQTEDMYKAWAGEQKPKVNNHVPLINIIASPDDTHLVRDSKSENKNKEHLPFNLKPCIATVSMKFDAKESVLTLHVDSVTDTSQPFDNINTLGYELHAAVIINGKTLRWHTKMVKGPNPKFSEKNEFQKVNAEHISKAALRLRLYVFEKHKKKQVRLEKNIALGNVNLGAETIHKFQLDNVSEHLGTDNSMTDLSSTSKLSNSSITSRSKISSKNATNASLIDLNNRTFWPELQIGLKYGKQIGKLSVDVMKVKKMQSLNLNSKLFVSITLKNTKGNTIKSVKTDTIIPSKVDDFGETFVFDILDTQIHDVNLIFRVFRKHKVHKQENCGWFVLGNANSSAAQKEHWEAMLKSNYDLIPRWHVLCAEH